MKHLFLEGPIQTGKSTLIREALKPYVASAPYLLGGFASQRLTVPAGDHTNADTGIQRTDCGQTTCAFRIGPAASTPLTLPLSDFLTARDLPADTPWAALVPHGLFKAFGSTPSSAPGKAFADGKSSIGGKAFANEKPFIGGKPFVDNSVFETLGVDYLKSTSGHQLMLLDEIGGHELLCPPFMAALYDLLAGDLPCIGVLKHLDNTKRMDPTLAAANEQLRKRIIEEFDGEILYYERGDQSVRTAVNAFLAAILQNS